MSWLKTKEQNKKLSDCLRAIEVKLGWGASSTWSSYDFDTLSEAIFLKTGTKLSTNTLKRVWGRLPYKSRPSTTTLNILAGFLGFGDWRGFILERQDNRNSFYLSKSKKKYILVVAVSVLLISLYPSIKESSFLQDRPDPEKFSFSSRRIIDGLPNSVIFDYKTPGLNDEDKVEIQQSWDDSKRRTISSSDSVATSVYYTPGFFRAKLVVNGTSVKEHGLLIPSGGWLGLLETKGLPLYFEQNDIVKRNKISISEEMITERLKDEDLGYERASLYYIEDFKDLNLNDFTIEMVVGAERKNSKTVCQASSITVYCEGEVIIVPLTSKGCISEIDLLILDRLISGKTNDLSKFGVDTTNEISVKLTSSNGFLSIFVNGSMAYSTKLDLEKRQSLSGIRYSFSDSGDIKNIVVKNTQQVFYMKSFPLTAKSDPLSTVQ